MLQIEICIKHLYKYSTITNKHDLKKRDNYYNSILTKILRQKSLVLIYMLLCTVPCTRTVHGKLFQTWNNNAHVGRHKTDRDKQNLL